jgi:spermidine synthase
MALLPPASPGARSRFLFASTIFLASFLLFLVEPIAAKQLLPLFGGSAAVWITCLVFFQTALLCAYLYAHWLTRHPKHRIHLALIFLAAAVAILWNFHQANSATTDHPILAILSALSISIGLPFLMLGATSPLLQVWQAQLETSAIPYRLYALSNLAALLALALYPTLIEPNLALKTQRLAWSCAFAAFALLSAFLTWNTRGPISGNPAPESPAPDSPAPQATQQDAPPSPLSHKLLWLLLPMAASMQLSAVTSYLTANIAPIPLLWILPLAVYLITLILAFQFPSFAPRGGRSILTRLLVIMLASLGYMMTKVDVTLPMTIGILFFLAELFVACLFLHSEATALRPRRTSESTLFYLLFAAGGASGAFLIGIAAPLLFRFNFDLALTFLATAVLGMAVTWPNPGPDPHNRGANAWGQRILWTTASILLLILTVRMNTAYQLETPVAVRNFYGSLRVKQNIGYPNAAVVRTLSNGNIQHGTQIFSPEMMTTPTTYYALDSGVGIALRNCCGNRPRKIGVIGLGAGTVAAYGQSGDQIRFYEINPAVIPIAHNVFTYLRDATQRGAQISIVEGDARTSLAHEPPQKFDVLVIDAFSGDAIPLHLLTTEAVALYKRHLAPGGILAFHISNQHVDLEPEIVLLAKSARMNVRRVTSPINEERGEFSATWMLATENAAFFNQSEVFNHAHQPHENPKLRLWTDDYSTLLPLLRW